MIFLWSQLAFAAPVHGVVRERGNGDPIAGAIVQIGNTVATTNEKGIFSLDISENELLSIDADGYQLATIKPRFGKKNRIWLTPDPATVHIVVEAFQPTAQTSRHRLDAELAHKTPGINDDPIRLVQALPSVATQREYSPTAGDLSVRGSSPGQNKYYLDGIEVPYLYHYNQYASVFPTSQLDSLELYPSTFGAAYGDAVGAVVEASSLRQRPNIVHGSVHMNLLMIGADVRVPLPKQWWVSASGRRSFHDIGGTRSTQYTLWPVFHDFSVRAQHQKTSFFAWGAGDSYQRAAGELDLLDPYEAKESPQFRYRRGFMGTGAEHRWRAGSFVAALLRDRRRGELSSLGREDLQTHSLSSRIHHELELSPKFRVEMGTEFRLEHTTLVVESAGKIGILVAEEAPALARGEPRDAQVGRFRGAVWAEGRWKSGAIRFFPGVRIPFDTAVIAVPPEPRLAVRWRAGPETEFKIATGLYHQAPATEWLLGQSGWRPPSDRIRPARSVQLSVGVEQTVANRLEFAVDLWGKHLTDTLDPRVEAIPEVLPNAWGVGGEFVVRYRLRDKFFINSWVGSTWIAAPIDNGFRPLDGDQRVHAGLVTSWDPGRHWNLGVRYRFGTGLPYTPIESVIYHAGEDSWSPVQADPNSARYPAYHKIDLHVEKRFVFKRWSLTIATEFGYIPKPSAQLYPTWNYNYSEQAWVLGPTFLPMVSARAEF